MDNQTIIELSEKYADETVRIRRDLHRIPEVSGTEVKTSKYIRDVLERLGIPYQMVSKTGLIATLDTGKPGPHIALRADIDGLPVQESENNLAHKRNVISENQNCHACGHDAHMAMLLTSIRILRENVDSLCGILYFCFEEGEENGGGWEKLLNELTKKKIDACWGIHVYAGLESGKICLDAGPRMAGAAGIDFTVIGKGGHGSRPDMAINPVYCAATILTNMATAWVNQITAGKTVTLGITSIQGGEVGNVIPDTARILGSLRFFDGEEGKKAFALFKDVAEHTAAMNKCRIEYSDKMMIACDPVTNDARLAALAQKDCAEVLPENAVTSIEPWYASDSYSQYCKRFPSIYAHLGINNPSYGSGAPHHNSYFDVDENVLPLGVKATLRFAQGVMDDWRNSNGTEKEKV